MAKQRHKIDIKKARAKMLSKLEAEGKRTSFFSKIKKQFTSGQKKNKSQVKDLRVDLLASHKEVQKPAAQKPTQEKPDNKKLDKSQKENKSFFQGLVSSQSLNQNKEQSQKSAKTTAEDERKKKISILKREKEIAKERKEAIRKKILAKRKAEKIAYLKAKEQARLNAKQKKDEQALKKKQQENEAKGLKKKKEVKITKTIKQSWLLFLKKRDASKKARLERVAVVKKEREQYLRASKNLKKDSSVKNANDNKRAVLKKKNQTPEPKKQVSERKTKLQDSWKTLLASLIGKRASDTSINKSNAKKQKLHYLKLEQRAWEEKLKKNIEVKKNLTSSGVKPPELKKADGKEVTTDTVKDLIKIDKKELEEKKLIPKKKSFWQKFSSKKNKKEKEQDKVEAKKELEKKAEIRAREEQKSRKQREKDLRKIKWQTPEILRANLVKGQIVGYINWRKNFAMLGVAVVVSLGILVGSYQYLGTRERTQEAFSEILLQKIDQTNQKIKLANENVDVILAFQKKIQLVDSVLENHIYWTEFFKFLENEISEDVYLHGFSGNLDGTYSLAASAKDFNTAAEQIKSLRKNESVFAVSTNGARAAESESGAIELVEFTISLNLDTNIFKK